MLVRTDDEIYRVDAVWLGPPRATFPWRARYVSYGVGLLVMMLIMMFQRQLGIGLDFISVAWALVGTVAITGFLGKKIDYERPLGQVLGQFWAEVTGPRADRRPSGGSVGARHVRIQTSRAQPAAALRAGATTRPWKVAGRGARPALADGAVPAPRAGSAAHPTGAAAALTDGAVPAPGATGGQFGKPVATKGPFVADRAPTVPAVVDGDSAEGPGSEPAEPRRVVPPLPDPVSAPKQGRFRKARGRIGKRGRRTGTAARTRQSEPWRSGGHRGRT
ncbi:MULTISPECIES: hypothetical protein [Pseudonocardia]|uniref:Uncharacterized protein n=2 Tax=Pseudonocardia TaxID=1847 RepID=A0A1Y2MS19_PSEAH|nr:MULTISPECIES: hypothetical protein [Pseudonocardia]OSY38013.1 hypothetical protein BG845_04420 [Pseudonocardia autotrophica]TDN74674.1 hypothetical protein C8E95_3801 [Pseudonocardia autotrophica]BBG05445.1 hypothetical protein Pdca_66540 [Pseudonocardia autotrophica]GEC26383.1 hypothetical protein PSA01_34120 [Pseudonocardia saturnea]